MTTLHIYAPPVTHRFIHAGTCLDCKRRTRFLGFAYEMYGANVTCLRCGREWSDGEWMPLPFVRGARQKNIDAAKRRWRRLAASEIPTAVPPADGDSPAAAGP